MGKLGDGDDAMPSKNKTLVTGCVAGELGDEGDVLSLKKASIFGEVWANKMSQYLQKKGIGYRVRFKEMGMKAS